MLYRLRDRRWTQKLRIFFSASSSGICPLTIHRAHAMPSGPVPVEIFFVTCQVLRSITAT